MKPSPPKKGPKNLADLFLAITWIGIQSFGGALAIAQRELVEKRAWFTNQEFVDMLTVSQSIPGPNVASLSIMIGDRFYGAKGAIAGGVAILWLPAMVLTALLLLYRDSSDAALVQGALRGVAAVAAGMVTGTALKLTRSAKNSALNLAVWGSISAGVFAAVCLFRLPLALVLACFGIPAVLYSGMLLRAEDTGEGK